MSNWFANALFSFEIEGQRPDALRVYKVKGREQMSQPFRFEVTLVAETPSIDLMEQIGRPATLSLKGLPQAGGGYVRQIHGRVERFEQLSAGKRYSQYQATLSPSLFPLSYSRNSRVFREQSTPEIVERVLVDGHVPKEQLHRMLHRPYAKRDFCVQYQESDLDFISRLLEEEGIFYFFVHEDGKDILVLGDGAHANQAVPYSDQLAYRDHPHLYEEVIHNLRAEARFRPGSTVLRDFRFKHPEVSMEATEAAQSFSDCQVYYFPGEYVDLDLGQRLAKIRLEELQCERSQIAAESNCPALLPGHTFALSGHWRSELSRRYLLTAVEHEGASPQALGEEHVAVSEVLYQNRFICIPDDVAFRPPRVTKRPCVLGVQSALVVGPLGEEIHCDDHGRVKVQFHWDRQGQRNDDSSCWIRVSQPWGGSTYGGIFIPRVGQEVLVQFLEGDPDRPVIVGRVYNGENLVPHGLPAQKNISAIRTSSTPGGGGFNEIRLDDTASSEEMFIHAQKNQNSVIRHNRTRVVGNDEIIRIAKHQSSHIGRNRTATIQNNDIKTVQQNDMQIIGLDWQTEVGHNHSLMVANDSFTSGNTVLIQAGKWLKLECNGGYILINEKGEVHIHGTLVFINCDEEEQDFSEQFTLVDEETGASIAGQKYRITRQDGSCIEGLTDDQGRTERVHTKGAEPLDIEVLYHY